MNKITLRGIIRNIVPSHKINDIEYNKADIIVKRKDGKEDVITVCYKKLSCKYKEDETVSLIGNIRSYSKKIDNEKNINFERGVPFNISAEGARVATWIIPTDEEYMIAIDTQRLASK